VTKILLISIPELSTNLDSLGLTYEFEDFSLRSFLTAMCLEMRRRTNLAVFSALPDQAENAVFTAL
jgi:hypothetical protein